MRRKIHWLILIIFFLCSFLFSNVKCNMFHKCIRPDFQFLILYCNQCSHTILKSLDIMCLRWEWEWAVFTPLAPDCDWNRKSVAAGQADVASLLHFIVYVLRIDIFDKGFLFFNLKALHRWVQGMWMSFHRWCIIVKSFTPPSFNN